LVSKAIQRRPKAREMRAFLFYTSSNVTVYRPTTSTVKWR